MEALFDGIPMGEVSTSMTINGPAPIMLAFYIACAERQGVDPKVLRGTIQNDILKEYQAQHAWLVPPEPALRMITDVMGYCAEHVPKWNTISISGYHIREAGSTAGQELAFTLGERPRIRSARHRGGYGRGRVRTPAFLLLRQPPGLLSRRSPSSVRRAVSGRARCAKSLAQKIRSRGCCGSTRRPPGVSLTAQQPENNIVRTAFEALAAVMGGTQSLHTNSMDETLSLPTEKAVKIALRTQQIIAEEIEVAHVADPLAGSYFVEATTNRLEEEAEAYFREIEDRGGVVPAILDGFFPTRDSSLCGQVPKGRRAGRPRKIVGVNCYTRGRCGPDHRDPQDPWRDRSGSS